MTPRLCVLVDERDRRLGRLMLPEACCVVAYAGRIFVRTQKAVKLHHAHRAVAIVFEETEVYHRKTLDPL